MPKEYLSEFRKLWNASGPGEYGKEYFTEKKAEWLKLKNDYEEGRISATKIVGKGLRNPEKSAKKYLEIQGDLWTNALETDGLSYPENVRKVMKKARKEGWKYSDDL